MQAAAPGDSVDCRWREGSESAGVTPDRNGKKIGNRRRFGVYFARKSPGSYLMYVLGSTYLDTEKQLLVTADRTVALQRKPYLVLLHLIENRHRMITREELLERFWEGQEVYDQSVSKAIGSIRKAFGETKESSRYIETRWGSGYRYVGPFDGESSAKPGDFPKIAAEHVSSDRVPVAADDGEDISLKAGDHRVAPATPLAEAPAGKSPGRSLRVYLAAAVVTIAAAFAILAAERQRHPAETEAAVLSNAEPKIGRASCRERV